MGSLAIGLVQQKEQLVARRVNVKGKDLFIDFYLQTWKLIVKTRNIHDQGVLVEIFATTFGGFLSRLMEI